MALQVQLPPVAPGADVSAVIVTHNSAGFIKGCLRSLREAAGDLGLEVFVVDNASTDGSAAAARAALPQATVIENAENRWFSAATNQAIRRSCGRYVLCLNPDTLVGPRALRVMVGFLDACPEAGAVGVWLLNADGSLQPSCCNFPSLPRLILQHVFPWRRLPPRLAGRADLRYAAHDAPQAVDWLVGACLMVRRETIAEVGLKDEAFPMFYEEADWCFRMRRAGWQVWFLPDAEVVHFGGTAVTERWGERAALEVYAAKHQLIGKWYGRTARGCHRAMLAGFFGVHFLRALAGRTVEELVGRGDRAYEYQRRLRLWTGLLRLRLPPGAPSARAK